jgi:hypothetical protein
MSIGLATTVAAPINTTDSQVHDTAGTFGAGIVMRPIGAIVLGVYAAANHYEVCPVKPIPFTPSTRGHRYLLASLDNWLVSLDPNGSNSAPTKRRSGEKTGGQGEAVRS